MGPFPWIRSHIVRMLPTPPTAVKRTQPSNKYEGTWRTVYPCKVSDGRETAIQKSVIIQTSILVHS